MWLLSGIRFDTFKVADYRVDGLYIKLDKKLILEADNVIIPQTKADPSFENLPETLDRIKYILTFFDSIVLKNIIFNNNTMSIRYKGDFLGLSSKDYEIIGMVKREGNMLKAEIPLLNLKKYNITLSGKLRYDLHANILSTEGFFRLYDALGRFNASKHGKVTVSKT